MWVPPRPSRPRSGADELIDALNGPPLGRWGSVEGTPQSGVGPTIANAPKPPDIQDATFPRAYALPDAAYLEQTALNSVVPMAGSLRKVAPLAAEELGIGGVLKMEADRMAKLSQSQFNKLRNSLPGAFSGQNWGDEFKAADDRLREELQRRAALREQQRMADRLDPTKFVEGRESAADFRRSNGPWAKRGR